MNTLSDLVSFVFIAQTTMLVITSVLLAYPVVTYARNVAHTRGLLLLAAAFLVLTVSYVASVPLGMSLASAVLDLTASVLAAAGIWQFARPFVQLDDQDVETPTVGDATGGFESAGDD
ncbi:hypothetical protein M0R89_14260 [Halorussus limi]|uniref:Uncharacterized protein n=1 Tax=Halorussus limi TaxID=2938695 RepID=A0A8U0HS44_9EURY|nr:hypothetical protein [Halorussus limi]UPV73697.1 hypothetical protein M0R89_14260 [Halorussus limi]